jgi:hypothetical protein
MCLQAYIVKEKIEKFKKQELEFEHGLFLHRPEIYEQYMKDKEEQETYGFDAIEWKQPETVEELQMILSAIHNSEENNENIEDYSAEQKFLQQFEGIDISQLGEDDG